MKRLIVILFMVLLAGYVMAEPAPLLVSGQLIFAMTSNFDEGTVNEWYSEAFFNAFKPLTENTSANIQFQALYKPDGQGDVKPFTALIDDFYGKSKIGKVLGIDPNVVDLELIFGWYAAAATTYTIGNYANENVATQDAGSMGTAALKTTLFNGPSLLAWFNPNAIGAPDGELNPPRFGANLMVPIGPVKTSVWYYTNGALDPKIGGSVGLSLAAGDFNAQADVEGAVIPADPDTAVYGAALRVGYTQYLGLATNFMGNKDGLQKIAFEVDSKILNSFGILSGVAFNGVTGAFDNAEIGGWVAWESIKVRFGYMVTDSSASMGTMYASAVPLNGGIWVKGYLNF